MHLSGGSGPNEGTVNLRVNDQWGSICDDYFGANEAMVICRMLGYFGQVKSFTSI